MLTHPHIAYFFHTPFIYLIILCGIVASVWIQKYVREPNLKGRYTNFRAVPDLHSTTLKELGNGLTRYDWDFFLEIQMVNDSDTRTTVDDFETEISLGLPWNETMFQSKRLDDLDSFDMDMCLNANGEANEQKLVGDRYRPVPSFAEKIKDVPLEQGIGYKGWLHYKVFQANQREINSVKTRIWIIDLTRTNTKFVSKRRIGGYRT